MKMFIYGLEFTVITYCLCFSEPKVFLIKILSVIVCQYFSHFSHLLQNQWAYFYQTRLEASLGQVNILGWPPSKGGGEGGFREYPW